MGGKKAMHAETGASLAPSSIPLTPLTLDTQLSSAHRCFTRANSTTSRQRPSQSTASSRDIKYFIDEFAYSVDAVSLEAEFIAMGRCDYRGGRDR